MDPPIPSEQFVRLLTGQQPRLLAYVLSLLPDYEAANNVLQDTNVVLWKKADQFEEGTNFFAWACQIARLEVLAHYRAQRRDRMTFNHDLLDQLAVEAQQQGEKSSKLSTYLAECLKARNPEELRLLQERYAPGGSVKKMAARLGEPENRLSVRMSRIRQALLKCIQRKLAADPS